MKFTFLKLHLTGARFAFLLKDTSPAFLVPRREVRVSPKRRETRTLKREVRVSSAENEPRVSDSKSEPCVSKTCISKLRRKTHVHSLTAEVKAELGSSHLQRLEIGLFNPLRRT